MKTLDYIKNIIKIMIWPILFGIGQFLVILIFTSNYNNNIYNDIVNANNTLKEEEITELFNIYIDTNEYKTNLTNYINDNTIWIVLIVAAIFIPILIFILKKYKTKFNFKLNKNIIPTVLAGLSLSIFLNLLIMNINNTFGIENGIFNNKYLVSTIISSVLLGPIIEELLFRGVMFNKLKTFNNLKPSMLITTFIFAFFHDTLTQMVFAFIVGYICVKLYNNYDTLLFPIIFHMGCNIIMPLFNNILLSLNMVYTIIVLISSLIIFIICYKNMYKKQD
ncbi:MAG: CPBP family intramembrane metalloprotease [Clostridium sp.]|nr:CPBP family intramembrane metalloprotease [Clostridium sp.]MCM1444357.1 CPBP family intramembrane metalloprotease [Candidatus Amulumruptor caecigallinarius]